MSLRHEILPDGGVHVHVGKGPYSDSEARRFAYGLLADLGDDEAALSLEAEDIQLAARFRAHFKLENRAAARLLLHMLNDPRRVVSKEMGVQLLGTEADPHLITVYICRIRKGLALRGFPEAVENVWGKGWRLKPGVAERIAAELAAP